MKTHVFIFFICLFTYYLQAGVPPKKPRVLHLYTWGLPAYGQERDSCVILLSASYGFDEKVKAGCVISFGQDRRWTRHNKKVRKKITRRLGKNWEEKYHLELSNCMR